MPRECPHVRGFTCPIMPGLDCPELPIADGKAAYCRREAMAAGYLKFHATGRLDRKEGYPPGDEPKYRLPDGSEL